MFHWATTVAAAAADGNESAKATAATAALVWMPCLIEWTPAWAQNTRGRAEVTAKLMIRAGAIPAILARISRAKIDLMLHRRAKSCRTREGAARTRLPFITRNSPQVNALI